MPNVSVKRCEHTNPYKKSSDTNILSHGRCDERQQSKAEGSTRPGYTGLRGGLKHLKIETKLINERFASVMGECVPSLPY